MTDGWMDGAAVGASALCLLHCLGLPLVALALPSLATAFGAGEGVHAALLAMAAPLAVVALRRGWRNHGAVAPAALGGAGLALMALALAAHELEQPLTVAGVSVLALAHLLNWRMRRLHPAR